jgi:hypothetical protein
VYKPHIDAFYWARMMLTAPIVEILRDLHHALVQDFWPCWLALSAVVVIGATWFVSQSSAPRSERRADTNIVLARQRLGTPASIVTLGVLVAFLVAYIAMTLVWEDFAYDDYSAFTLTTLRGHDIPPPISGPALGHGGRFFPLGWQEFNLIRHFTDSAIGYHLLPIAELLVLVFILLILDDELGIVARVSLAILALLTPSILISLGDLPAPERSELLFLAGLILCVKRFEETESTGWAAGAVLCAQIMLYYKETAFLLVLGLAGGRLLLRYVSGERARWDIGRLSDRQGRLDLSLIGVVVLFLIYYFAVMGLRPNMNYAIWNQQPFVGTLLAYTKRDVLAWLLAAVAAGRIYLILRGRAAPLPLWDGLALGGVACFVGYLYLRLVKPWYLAPVDLIGVLYVGRFAVSLESTHLSSKSIVLSLMFIVVCQNIVFSAAKLYERKNAIHGKVEIARVVEEQYRIRAGHPLRLFFPFAQPYSIMEFAAYLSHQGIPVEGGDGADAGRPDHVVLAGRAVAIDGRCLGYNTIQCHAAIRPAGGDLVIVLPNDSPSRAQASPYRARGELFYYEPRPTIPVWLLALITDLAGHLYIAIPDGWMEGSVTIWQ